MKPFLVLILLLCACTPAATKAHPGLIHPANPFQVGQVWAVRSASRLERSVVPVTTFQIRSVDAGGLQILGRNTAMAEAGNVYVSFDTAHQLVLVVDDSAKQRGTATSRFCFFGAHSPSIRYSGSAAHIIFSTVEQDPIEFVAAYRSEHPAAAPDEAISEYTRAIAPDDNGPCTLELVR